MARGPLNIFIAYEQVDTYFYEELIKHLSSMQKERREHVIIISSHSTVKAGTELKQEIVHQIEQSRLILLLISSDFMHSPRCYNLELQEAMKCHRARTARVIPIILRPTYTTGAPFQALSALPKNNLPLDGQNIDEALNKIIQELRAFIDDVSQPLPLTTSQQLRIPLPYERNLLFTGREALLERIHNSFRLGTTTALTQAISGLGGIGKTQTALEYAYRYEQDYEIILWMRAGSAEKIDTDLTVIAEALQLPERFEKEPAVVLRGFKRWLREHEHWLLVLDNADDLAVIQDLPPPQSKGHTLITTRTQHVGRKARSIEIEVMGLEEGKLFLLRRAGILEADAPLINARQREQTAAQELVKLVDGLPLALNQAGAYIEETQCGLEGYLRRFEMRQEYLLRQRGEGNFDYPDSVATTWSLSFEKVQQTSQTAADLLRVCAMLAPDEIPEEMLIEGASELGPFLQAFRIDSLQLDNAIRVLRTYSFITRNSTTAMLTIHRLVQAIQKQAMGEEEQRVWAERVIRAIDLTFPKIDYKTVLQCQQYLPHALKCNEYIENWNMKFSEAAHLLNEIGYFLKHQMNFALAEPFYLRARNIWEQILGSEHPSVAIILNNLALLYDNQREYAQAKPLYKRALYIREQVLGPEHPDTASTLNNLAGLYRNQGKYEKAEKFYQKALKIREKKLGSEHSDTASTLNNLAGLYRNQGKYEKAEPLYKRALHIMEQALGPEHPDIASCINSLAILYEGQGKYAQAEKFYQKALKIREKKLGSEHPDFANTLNNLAGFYYDQGEYERAEPLWKRAIYIFDKKLGPQHPHTVTAKEDYKYLVEKMKKIQQEHE